MSEPDQTADEAGRTARIRELNDAFRKAPNSLGKLCLTRSIAAMTERRFLSSWAA
ncbi:hypothetical protein M2322_004587 [Rhodoblastus acidophilus]|nr:hypothetical protein [Rhodoblastus acidophilus]